jgi:hypothetical protein
MGYTVCLSTWVECMAIPEDVFFNLPFNFWI